MILRIWAFGDVQPQNAGHWTEFDNVLADVSSNMEFEMALVAGDIVNDGEVAADFATYKGKIAGINSLRWGFFHLAGNHDFQNGGTLTNYLAAVQDETLYTFTLGNLFFIIMSDEDQSAGGEKGATTFNWWRALVIANQDKNIITVTHHPLYDTTRRSTEANYYIANSDRFSDVLQTYDVALWLHGHIPTSLEQANVFVEKWGTLHMNVGLHLPEGFDPCSRLLTFVEDSKNVNVKLRNHVTPTWNPTYEVNYELPHIFRFTIDIDEDYPENYPYCDECGGPLGVHAGIRVLGVRYHNYECILGLKHSGDYE